MRKHGKTEYRVYKFVCRHPGLSTYEISKKLKMSGGNVRNALSNLHKKGLVFFRFERSNPRIRKLTFPVSVWKLLPRVLRKELKSIVKKVR